MKIVKSFVLICILTSSCFGVVRNESVENKEMEINNEQAMLSKKADTALSFCKEKNMNTDFCILIDMKIHSGKNRFFIWDFKNDTILGAGMCAHGYGGNSTDRKSVV